MMTNARSGLTVGLLMAAVIAGCAPAPAPAPPAPETTARQAPPAPLAERPLEFPPFRETRLENGLRVIIVEHAGQPIANVNLYVRSGAAAEPAERAGLAGMAAELLTKGTTTRTAREIAETIEGVGGQLNSSSGNDWVTVSASVLSDYLPLAFDLVSDVTLRPTFPADEVTVTRRRTLSGLQAQLGQPSAIAQRAFLRGVYGPAHPYGVSPVPGTVEAITRDELVRFHHDHFAADNALLVVSGVVDPAEVEALARRHFGDWRTGASARAELPQPPAVERTRIALVHRPGSVQSNIRIGHLAIRPDDPAYFPLTVLNNIVGGGTDARLFQILREEKGWTYGAYSQLTRPVDIGYFMANAEVRTEVTDSALAEMLRQLDRIRDEPVPVDEFQGALSFLAGSFPLRIETAGQIGSQLAQAALLDVPFEYVTEFRDRILAVTPQDVQHAARQYVRPDRAHIVVVGDARQLVPMIEPIAPISLYDVEGTPLDREAIEVRAAEERFDASRLVAGSRTYQLMFQGNPLGTVRSTLERDGDEWVATSVTESPGATQRSEVRFSALDMSPVSSSMEARQGPNELNVDLQYDQGRVTGRIDVPDALGGARDVDVEVPEGTLLSGMDDYVIAIADLGEGRSITLPMFDAMSGSVATLSLQVTGVDEVTVPAGTFQVYRVEMTAGQQRMGLMVRQEAPHIVVKQEVAGMPVTVELLTID